MLVMSSSSKPGPRARLAGWLLAIDGAAESDAARGCARLHTRGNIRVYLFRNFDLTGLETEAVAFTTNLHPCSLTLRFSFSGCVSWSEWLGDAFVTTSRCVAYVAFALSVAIF